MAETKAFEVQDKDLEIADDLSAPTIFIDGMQGLMQGGGMVRVGLFQIVQDLRGSQERLEVKKKIVGRLVMTPEVAAGIAKWLGVQMRPEEQSAESPR